MKLTLHQKTLLSIGGTIATLIIIINAISSLFLLEGLRKAEKKNAQQTVRGVLNVLDKTKEDFNSRYHDWAAWDDTYKFIQDRNKDYIKSNLTEQQLASLKVNLVLYSKLDGKIVFGTGFNYKKKQFLPIPQQFKQGLSPQNILINSHNKTQSHQTGIIQIDKTPFLITSQPILNSEGKGLIRGKLIFGREINADFINNLSKITRLPVSAYSFNQTQTNADFQQARQLLSLQQPIIVRTLNDQLLAGYALITDIYNQPVMMLRVDVPREIYKQGQESQRTLFITILVMGLILCGANLLQLEYFVLARLDYLSNTVGKIRDSKNISLRLSVSGTDELSTLNSDINGMLEAIEHSQKELNHANVELEKKNLLIRKVFGRYLSDEVVANLLESPEGLKLGGERRSITIVTSDLRGFTAISERLPPEEVIHLLNFYLHNMADVITKHQGTIDEIMGDGILILFGAPIVREDDAIRAIACAIEMQLAMKSVNEMMEEWGLPSLQMGIGINTGEVVVGNIGSDKRTKYGIVGSQVNLAYRIESYTIGGQILISESTFKKVGSMVKINNQMQVQPKGVKEPITIYEVGGLGGTYNLFLNEKEEIFWNLPQEIPLKYTILEGKHIGDNIFNGALVELSENAAKIHTNHINSGTLPTKLTNIKLNLITSQSQKEISEDIYAKVLEKPAEKGSFYIYFTNKPPTVREKLDTIYKTINK